MTEYYRLIIDFAHEELGEAFDTLADALSDAIVEILDPEHLPDVPCARDWFMRGGSVTAEYKLHAETLANQYVSAFREKLKETDSVDEFLQESSGDDHGE